MKRIIAVLTAMVLLMTCVSLVGTVSAADDLLLESFDSSFNGEEMGFNTQLDYGAPIFSTTTSNTEGGEGMKVEWGTKKLNGSYGETGVHQMIATADWSTTTFAENAEDYSYLRFWLSNPTKKEVLVMTRLITANTKVHFKAHRATVSNSSGVVQSHTYSNDITDYGFGSWTTINIPAYFEGWIAYPLDTVDRTGLTSSSRPALDSFSSTTNIEFNFYLKERTIDQGYYYVIDNLTLSDSPRGVEPPTTTTEPTTPAPPARTLMLENFTGVTDFSYMNPQEHKNYALPTMESTDTGVDEGEAMRVNWASTNLQSYVHTFIPEAEWANETFAENAEDYTYLRLWICNPTFVQLDLTVRLITDSTKAYMNAESAVVSRKDGTKISHASGNATATGAGSSITIPSSFAGWVAYPISTANTSGATGRVNISDFSDVTNIEIDVRRPVTLDTGTYYVLDDICLTTATVGTLQTSGDSVFDDLGGEKIDSQIKNVIVLVGDGMGQTILQATRDHLGTDLYMDGMEKSNLEICSDNIRNELTDSAAGGTALSCGVRTENGYVAIDSAGRAVENMVEFFRRAGKKTGLVTTSYLLDATPATYGSRASNRGDYAAVAEGMFNNNISVLIGGGSDYMATNINRGGRNYTLTQYAQENYGYTYVSTADELRNFNGEKVLGIFGSGYMDYEQDRTTQMPVDEMTEKAISLLENDEGFFLMVEGGNIDHAAHNNDFNRTVTDTVVFDKAVKVALDYIEDNPDTLVVVCADHSTGGLVASGSGYRFTTNQHDQSLTACFASGNGSEYFVDLKENADIANAIRNAALGTDPDDQESTTQPPSSQEPSTQPPTTAEPSTQAPTNAPTTQAPTTKAPTTAVPTPQPTTKAPTQAPTTAEPATPAAKKPAKVKKVTAKSKAKKKIVVTWKAAKNAKKYVVKYSYKKNMKSAKTVTVKKLKATLKKLKSGKKVYIQVQGVNGKVKGKWSAKKSVKVK